MKYDISIVVPIYNAQKYIAKCAETLLEQNYNNIEYIFIDDSSIDKSIQILNDVMKKYPNRINDINIIKNEKNMGVSYTRKLGMQVARGEYVIQIDSDDWVELNMCKELYLKAKETNADIVTSDYFENFKNKQNYIKQDYSEDIDFFKSILLSSLHGSLCNKLIKRQLYIDFDIYPFEEFNLFEDKFVSLRLFSSTKKIAYISKAFLHYRQHESSYTSQHVKNKHIQDTILFINAVNDFFKFNNLFDQYQAEFNSFVLYHKKIFLLDENYYYLWDDFFPEVNKVKYVLNIDAYDFKKKLITIFTLIFGKGIMRVSYNYYRRNRSN